MNDFYGDSVRWFFGDVVDIDDPVQIGRVKVRINGLHQDSVSDDDLPFAQTLMPVTQGGTKELGNPLGLQVGARVFGVFMDGKDSQLPLVIGSVPKFEDRTQAVNARPHEAFQANESGATGSVIPNQQFVANPNFSIANAGVASQVSDVLAEVTDLPGIPPEVNNALSSVSSAVDDAITAISGKVSTATALDDLVNDATSAATSAVEGAVSGAVTQATGAVQSAIAPVTSTIADVEAAVGEVTAVGTEVTATVDTAINTAIDVLEPLSGVSSTAADALSELEALGSTGTLASGLPAAGLVAGVIGGGLKKASGLFSDATKGAVGIVDVDNDKSLSRLTRGKDLLAQPNKDFITEAGFLLTPTEPENPYKAKYPHNKVTETSSGHVFEVDDTPGAERINVRHKSGSRVEFHPNGDVITTHKNGFQIATGDHNIHIKGDLNITVEGSMDINVLGSKKEIIGLTKSETVGLTSSEIVGLTKSITTGGNTSITTLLGVINLN